MLSAARLASASQQAGTGDVNLNAIAAAVIGGTSLFGGRGSAYSALLGIIVIQSIASGLTLLDLSSSLRYMITGAVLAIAVIVDSLARRSRVVARPGLNPSAGRSHELRNSAAKSPPITGAASGIGLECAQDAARRRRAAWCWSTAPRTALNSALRRTRPAGASRWWST